MSRLRIESGLECFDHHESAALEAMLRKVVAAHSPSLSVAPETMSHYWDAEKFGLERSRAFQDFSPEARGQILAALSRRTLELSYYIEKTGLHFGAKMLLLSESLEEKSLYGTFTFDEVFHRCLFERFLGTDVRRDLDFHPLLAPLARAVESGSRETCWLLIQVLLEGFGLAYYADLAATCRSQPLREVFQTILKDEARHHGIGLVLTRNLDPRLVGSDENFELARDFLSAIQSAGWIGRAFTEVVPGWSESDSQRLYQDIGFDDRLALRRRKVRELFESLPNAGLLIARLEKEKLF